MRQPPCLLVGCLASWHNRVAVLFVSAVAGHVCRTSATRGCARCCGRRASSSAVKDLEGLQDPAYAAKTARIEHLYAIADRAIAPARATAGDLLRGRVWAAQPAAPARPAMGGDQRQEQRARPGAAALPARDLYPHQRGAAPVRRL